MPNIQAMIDKKVQGGSEVYRFPSTSVKYYTHISMTEYKGYGGSFWNPYQGDGDSIILPLPVELTEMEGVSWDEKPLVDWASIAQSAATLGLGSAAGSLLKQTTSGASRGKKAFLAGLGLLAGGGAIAAATGGSFLSGLTGLAPSSFQTVLFDRPLMKRHELSFKLSPRNFDESRQIRDMIDRIKKAKAPGIALGRTTFKFPDLFHIKFMVQGAESDWLFQFQPCVCDTIAVDYAGGDKKKAFYAGDENPPESVHMTLRFIEVDYWLKEDYPTYPRGNSPIQRQYNASQQPQEPQPGTEAAFNSSINQIFDQAQDDPRNTNNPLRRR